MIEHQTYSHFLLVRHLTSLVVLCLIITAAATSSTTTLYAGDADSPTVSDLGVIDGFGPAIATGTSGDGSVIVGISDSPNGKRAFRWTALTGPQNLGVLTPTHVYSAAAAVSTDGQFVAGVSAGYAGVRESFRWSSATGMQALGHLSPQHSDTRAYGISADGQTIVGSSLTANGSRAFRWTTSGGIQDIGTLPNQSVSTALDASADGTAVVGVSGAGNSRRSFLWRSEDGLHDLGVLEGYQWSQANSVSDDSTVVVGVCGGGPPTGAALSPYIWTESEGMQQINLGALAMVASAQCVSGDGLCIGGHLGPSISQQVAFKWSEKEGLTLLGGAPGLLDSEVIALSDDGQFAVGGTNYALPSPDHFSALGADSRAVIWGDSTTAIVVGGLPGSEYLFLNDVSDDASAAAGTSSGSSGRRAVRWLESSGLEDLGTLPNTAISSAQGISGDGSTVVGHCISSDGNTTAFLWTDTGGMVGLASPVTGESSWATATSYNGSVVVGSIGDLAIDDRRAARWSAELGWHDLGYLPDATNSLATAVSHDGSVVVGQSGTSVSVTSAFRWTEATGMIALPRPAGHVYTVATAVSADGLTVVGVSGDSSSSARAVAWAPDGTMQFLTSADGISGRRALATNTPASIVTGYGITSGFQTNEAWIWTSQEGVVLVEDLFTAAGGTQGDWLFASCCGVSDDGSVMLGTGYIGEVFVPRGWRIVGPKQFADCDADDVPDYVEIDSGIPDCNQNNVPDDCDYDGLFYTPLQTPFGFGVALDYTFGNMELAANDVLITVEARGDLDSIAEFATLTLDDVTVAAVWVTTGQQCPQLSQSLEVSIPARLFNTLVVDGELRVILEASPLVDSAECLASRAQISVRYNNGFLDCNDNGLDDLCDISTGLLVDCNQNGDPDLCETNKYPEIDCDNDGQIDACQIASDPSLDENYDGYLDVCSYHLGDFDLDRQVGGTDLAVMLSLWDTQNPLVGDLTGDGSVNGADLTVLLGNWGPY